VLQCLRPMDGDEEDFIYEDEGDGPEELELEYAECGLEEVNDFLGDDALCDLCGTRDLSSVLFLETRIDSEEITMRDLGARLPNMNELKLNNSNIPCIRDLGTSFSHLQVLWLSRCNLKELDGISAFGSLRELYLSFNQVKDLSPLGACDTLEVLDLEGNCVDDICEVQFLAACVKLTCLTLESNPVEREEGYRRSVCEALPSLQTLDDVPTSDLDAPSTTRHLDTVLLADSTSLTAERVPHETPIDFDAMLRKAQINPDEMPEIALRQPSPQATTALQRVVTELDMVHRGIKFGRVGLDDPSFEGLEPMDRQRPGTRGSRRPMSASVAVRPRSSGRGRPGSASLALRPTTSWGGTPRPRTPSSSSRPATAYGQGSRGQDAEDHSRVNSMAATGESSSDLTFGSEEVFCGNPVMALRGRKAESLPATDLPRSGSAKAELGDDEILEELKRWKIDTAAVAMTPDPEELPPMEIGATIGGGGDCDRLVIDAFDTTEEDRVTHHRRGSDPTPDRSTMQPVSPSKPRSAHRTSSSSSSSSSGRPSSGSGRVRTKVTSTPADGDVAARTVKIQANGLVSVAAAAPPRPPVSRERPRRPASGTTAVATAVAGGGSGAAAGQG